jgi:hypothetical protein
LRDLNSVVIPRLGFTFFQNFLFKIFFPNFQNPGRSELSDTQGNFGTNPRVFGGKVWSTGHTSWPRRPAPGPFLTRSFPIAFYPLRVQHLCSGMVKFQGKERFSPFKSINSSLSLSLLFQSSCSSSPLPWIPSMLYPPLPPQGISHR